MKTNPYFIENIFIDFITDNLETHMADIMDPSKIKIIVDALFVALIVIVLLVRPSGLFGRVVVSRV